MTEIFRATLSDLDYIDHLSRNESEAVGFIPKSRYEKEITGESNGLVLVAKENNDHVGFLYATRNNQGVTHIQQVAIQEDARRLERATLLVEASIRPTDWLVSLRCATDLDSTKFWESLGFQVESITSPANRRKRSILRFQKVVGGLWLPGEVKTNAE